MQLLAAGETPTSGASADARGAQGDEPGATGEMRAGTAKAPITPEAHYNLAGYTRGEGVISALLRHRRATGVHDDIYARCLALSDGSTTLALVALDLIGFFHEDVLAVRQQVEDLTGRRDVLVMVASTHTHSAPDTYGIYGGVPQAYRRLVHRRAAEAVAQALQALAPARLSALETRVEGLVANLRHPERGATDPVVSALLVDRAGPAPPTTAPGPAAPTTVPGPATPAPAVRPVATAAVPGPAATGALGTAAPAICTLVNFACHPNILGITNTLISADFPGYLCRHLEEGRGGMGLFFNGAVGDIHPALAVFAPGGKPDIPDERGLRTFDTAREAAETLGRAVLTAPPEPLTAGRNASLTVTRREIYVPADNRLLKLLRYLGVIRRRLYRGLVKTESWHIDLGPAQILTIPGQLMCRQGMALRERMTGRFRFLIGLANDEIAYIIPPEEFGHGGEEVVSLGPRVWPSLRQQLPLEGEPARG